MSFQGPSAPSREPLIDKLTGLCSEKWLTWFRNVRQSLDSAPTQVTGGKVQLTGQTATIGTTPVPTASLAAGLYAVRWYGQVTSPAGVASSFQVTVSWTTNGVTQTFVGALKNGNTTATNEPSGPALIHIDPATPVSYAIAYVSNPAAAMVFDFDLWLELVSLD